MLKHAGRRPKLTRDEREKREAKRQRTNRDEKLFDKRYGGLAKALGDPDLYRRIK